MEGPIPDCAFPERSQQPSPEPHYIYLAREKSKCGFLLFLSSSEFSGVGQLEKFNQIKAGGHSATWPDDQGRQLVLVSETTKIIHIRSGLQVASEPKAPGWKSALDLACILLSLPIWLPLMILLMLVTRISSPGPIFYRQRTRRSWGKTFFYLEVPDNEGER